MPSETPQLSLTELHQDAIKAANSSWTETDKLYVSVCSALIALAAIFGWGKAESKLPLLIVGALLIFLAFNWTLLIRRYRRKILRSLRALYAGQDDPEIKAYFAYERDRFQKDPLDYLIVGLVFVAAVALIMIVLLTHFGLLNLRAFGSLSAYDAD